MALIARNRLAALCGLEVPTASEILNPLKMSSYDVGGKIGPWPIFSLTESELVAGRNNKHLDFNAFKFRKWIFLSNLIRIFT